MASQGPLSPGTAVDDATIGAIAWVAGTTLAAAMAASDNDRAQAGSFSSTDVTHYLKTTNFGFTVPTGATVDGIIVEVERQADDNAAPAGSQMEDNAVRIVKANVIKTTDKSAAGTEWPGTDTYATYGSASDLWGETWTPAEINASDFGFAIGAKRTNASGTGNVYIDHVRITVHYTEATSAMSLIL